MSRLDPTFVRREIEALRLTHPGIWDDEDDRQLAIESETGLHEFLAQVVDRRQGAEATASGIDELFKLWKARLARYEQRVDAMRALAFKLMTAADVRKVELPAATLSIRAGTPRVIITDETLLPEDCVRIKREPDKIAIKERLMRGESVAGAEMSNAEPVLNTRIK